ncbi:MAG: 3-deoxy-8-phosphooctulonate synthase [Armatimonadota bacterium]
MNGITPITIGDFQIGAEGAPLTLIAGPCVIESELGCMDTASYMAEICVDLGINYIFKASWDKANRTSIHSYRGPGLERGLEILNNVKQKLKLPVLSDVHETGHVGKVAQVVDMLQIPAFLCRQTDLLIACAETGVPVNVKKGQFLAAWDMKNVLEKLREAGCRQAMLTERGSSFGYNTLIVDYTSLPTMRSYGVPVCFDATHSLQLPGGAGSSSGGRREFVPQVVRAAAAVGMDALFMEVHPNPTKGLSDASTMYPLDKMRELLTQVLAIRAAVNE